MQEYRFETGKLVGDIAEVGVSIPGIKITKLSLPNLVSVTKDDSLVLHIGESGEVERVSICSTLDLSKFAEDTAKMMAGNLTYDDGK